MSREMRHSGIEWIGEIPKEWEVVRLRNLGVFSASGIDKNIVEGEEPIHIVNYVDVYNNLTKELRKQDYMLVTAPKNKCQEHQLRIGDMIFTPSSETIDDIGVSSVVMEELPNTAYSYHVLRFRSNDDIELNYKKYFTNNQAILNYFSSCATGTIRKTISRDVFKECKVVLPPLSEQQKIANYLDKVCGEVDEMIALQEQMIEELKAYKQSVITEAVTKGLNPNVPMKDSGIDWIGEVPEHWRIVPIKHIKSKEPNAFVDGPFGSNLKSEHFIENGDVLVVESGFITTGKFVFKEFKTISKEHFETIKRSQCKAKDIIIAKIGANYGMAGELPDLGKLSVVSGNSLKITLDNSKMLNTIFVNAMICAKNNSGFKGMVQENAQPALSLSGLNNFKLPVPPLSEQQSIASYLDTKCAEIDALIAIKQTKIEELKDYKKSVIYEYVTGKKEVV